MRFFILALLFAVLPWRLAAADVLDAARTAGVFDSFLRLVQEAALGDRLAGGRRTTVFMPTDAAFDRLPPESRRRLFDANREALRAIVLQHVVPGRSLPSDALPRELETAGGGRLLVTWERRDLTIHSDPRPVAGEAARVVIGDIHAGNGRIHGIDAILLPLEALTGADEVDRAEEVPPAQPGERRTAVDVPAAPRPPPGLRDREPTLFEPQRRSAGAGRPPPSAVAAAPADDDLPAPPPPADRDEGAGGDREGTRETVAAAAIAVDRIKDMEIVSRDLERRGTVRHVVVSPATGEIEAVVAEFGDLMGLFGRRIVIAWADIRIARGQARLIADMTGREIERAAPVEETRPALAD